MRPFSRATLVFSVLIILSHCTTAHFAGRKKSNSAENSNQDNTPLAEKPGATVGDGSTPPVDNPPNGGAPTDGSTQKPKVSIKEGCKDSDFIQPDWPQVIAACVNGGKIYNFDKSSCSAIPQAKFACNWSNILTEENRVMQGDTPEPRIGSVNRQAWSKIVGCGEYADSNYHILILQYWTANNEKDLDKCEMAAGWNIHTSCRIFKKKKDLADITWQNCLDYTP